MASIQIPQSTRNLRACLVCSIVLQRATFLNSGCPNCPFLEIQRSGADDSALEECTSAVFEGMIAMNDPRTSWVAKWQRVSDYQPGVYAVKVVGRLSPERITDAAENDVVYFPRDGTKPEEWELEKDREEA